MIDRIKDSIWEFTKDALGKVMYNIFMSKKDEWVEELSEEINTTDIEWVKFRNTLYLSIIDKITSEENA